MKKIIYISVWLLGGLLTSYGQSPKLKKANKEYSNYSYMEAVPIYEKVFNKGYKSVEMLESLGNSYYFNGEYVDAAKWYGELFSLEPKATDPEYYYRYSQSLKSIGDLQKSQEYLNKYFQTKGDEDDSRKLVSKDYLDVIEKNSDRFKIASVKALNTKNAEYGTTFHEGDLIFSSTRGRKDWLVYRTQSWSGQRHEALYVSKIDDQGNPGKPKKFSTDLSSRFSETTPTFTFDGKTIYFTRHNYLKKRGFDSERTTRLKVYRAVLKNGKWKDVTELPFNSDDYSVAHPSLSLDEKTLYFVSDMPGGFGGSDIWKVSVNADGSFGTPENLGAAINTEGRETFPFIAKNNELYYSSDGKLGLGGLDVFVSKFTNGTYEEAINVGKPINGPWDDFSFYYDSDYRKGYFSSNRTEGKGLDDIYKFIETIPLMIKQSIVGTVADTDTGEPIADAVVHLYDDQGNIIGNTTTDQNGKYTFGEDLVKGSTLYRIRASAEGHNIDERALTTNNVNGYVNVEDFSVRKSGVALTPGTNIAEVLNIPVIYFDFDMSDIRPDAVVELAKILQVMEDYPKLKIDIRSHTDSRGSHAYNEDLSDRRAKSTRGWLISKGISARRLTAKGYGETQLKTNCPDGVWCSEADHQLNRRSEFIIMK